MATLFSLFILFLQSRLQDQLKACKKEIQTLIEMIDERDQVCEKQQETIQRMDIECCQLKNENSVSFFIHFMIHCF